MSELDMKQAISSDLKTQFASGTDLFYKIDAITTDSALDQKDTFYINQKWDEQFGKYKKIPELRGAINTKAVWVVGKGFVADPQTTLLLNSIRGNGFDSFNGILRNNEATRDVGGDSFCNIIRHKFGEVKGKLLNLKPLDPGTIETHINRAGIITHFMQVSKGGRPKKRIEIEEMFYLSRERIADEMHGISVIDAVEEIILMRNEAMADYRMVMHRFVRPRFIFHLDTDDATEIANIKKTNDAATGKGENLYVPKGNVTPELLSVAPNSTLDPKAWIEQLNDYFYEAVGVPKVIIGNSKNFTDASSKIVYLAFEQRIRAHQLYIVEQVRQQLGLVIELPFPASLEGDAISGRPRDASLEANPPEIEGVEQAAQPKDLTAELKGGRK